MNIDSKATKAAIIESATECVDFYMYRNEQLKTAVYFLAALVCVGFIF